MKNKISNGFQIIHDLIKLKWVAEIIESIDLGNQRYNEILNSIQYISHTELNRKLSMLVEKGVIKKIRDDNKTFYKLTSFGNELVHIFRHLGKLEDTYIDRLA